MAQNTTSADAARAMALYCMDHPDLIDTTCADVRSNYEYRIWLAPNAAFIALFSISLIAFLATYAVTRRGLFFTVAFSLGLVCEILGYVGRVLSWQNQWSENGFLIQICLLTIGPAFLAAGIYLCLRRIVVAFGPANSRIPPKMYTRIFIPCDVISLVLQATGGGMASVASQNGDSVDTGDNIMIAGLSFQVLTLLVFMIAAADFGLRTYRRTRRLGADAALSQDPRTHAVRNSAMFRLFLGALALSTVAIFIRSVYRVAELSKGWDGPLMKRQDMFVGFEGALIVLACAVLNIFHPAVCFGSLMDRSAEAGALGTAPEKTAVGSSGESASDADTRRDGTYV